MDENNKVQVTEIFDMTDSESRVLSPNEIEVNTSLQFDEWNEQTWLAQHARPDGKLTYKKNLIKFYVIKCDTFFRRYW